MQTFIQSVLQEVLQKEEDISEYIFILPSKRAGLNLKSELARFSVSAIFAPKVFSIEEFIEEIAEMKSMDNITALFQFYAVYQEITPKEEIEDFDTFAAWAQTLIYDFNEIDRYLIEPKKFFNYLSEIKDVEHWYLQENKTELVKSYLAFWNKLPLYYESFKQKMLSQKEAYQGYIFRRASEKVADYIQKINAPHVFLGFNALNSSEQIIFQEFLSSKKAEVYWDADEIFLNDPYHDASHFLRSYFKSWEYYQTNSVKYISSNFKDEKNLKLIGIPKNIGQAKYVGELLSNLNANQIQETAVVLGDEALLLPLLNSLPKNVEHVNITMGFPIKYAPIASLFEQIFKMHINFKGKFYYKDVLAIFNHPINQKLWKNTANKLVTSIQEENLTHLSLEEIQRYNAGKDNIIDLLFSDFQNNVPTAINRFKELIYAIKSVLSKEEDKILLEMLFSFHKLFTKLENITKEYPYLKNLKALFNLYKDLVNSTTLDFRGEPFKGLQIMGVLESRVLDFENVIITSVNEGVLPAGKSANSFIPYDLKAANNLPTFKEKDAVYAYHFYHLLQRTKNAHLLYNSEPGGLNAGEKSRFLIQLEIEKQANHKIENVVVGPQVPKVLSKLKVVEKTPEIILRIKEFAAQGFSPSALTTYVRNPLDFYKQYILGIKENKEVEETVAANTLGTVIHNTLENLYKPLTEKKGKITKKCLETALLKAPEEIVHQFYTVYTKSPLNKGKNLIIFEVAKRYVSNFLKSEIKEVENGNEIKIIQLEAKLKQQIKVEGLDFPIAIRGVVDRVDKYNGILRIIDYKTGKVQKNQLQVANWEELTTDYDKYSKPFQILAYASMMRSESPFTAPIEAGVFSFKNMQAGFLKFEKKDENSRNRTSLIDDKILDDYLLQLKELIAEICNPEVPFIEKEIKQKTW